MQFQIIYLTNIFQALKFLFIGSREFFRVIGFSSKAATRTSRVLKSCRLSDSLCLQHHKSTTSCFFSLLLWGTGWKYSHKRDTDVKRFAVIECNLGFWSNRSHYSCFDGMMKLVQKPNFYLTFKVWSGLFQDTHSTNCCLLNLMLQSGHEIWWQHFILMHLFLCPLAQK